MFDFVFFLLVLELGHDRDPVSSRDERDLHLNLLTSSSPVQMIPNILGIRYFLFYFIY